MKDCIVYNGKLFQVLNRTKEATLTVAGNTISKRVQYELVRRPPGVRAIVVKKDKLLLTYEYRYELNEWDYRLPGGKVCDTTDEYVWSLTQGTIDEDVTKKLKQELLEEAGVNVLQYRPLNILHCGMTVEWDLYYFLVDDFTILPHTSVQKSEYEFIENRWVDFSEALTLCLEGKVSEARSAFEIIRFILKTQQGVDDHAYLPISQ